MIFLEQHSCQLFLKNGSPMMSQNGHMKIFIGLIIVGLLLTTYYYIGEFSYFKYAQLFSSSRYFRSLEITSYFCYLNGSETKTKGYIVYSPSCRIPDINPRDSSIKQFLRKETRSKCSEEEKISWVSHFDDHYMLHIDSTKTKNLTCCYARIERKSARVESSHDLLEGPCTRIRDTANLTSPKDELIKVSCSGRGKQKKKGKSYTSVHLLVQKKKVALKAQNGSKKKMSVMILGIDSISRLNFLRSMPTTAKYLEDRGWIEFKGYNKIDDNTFPNLMGVLTGLSFDDIKKTCWERWEPADNCPYLWKNFSDAGYVTAYSEDEVSISTFNYHKAGFEHAPTDFYLRPYFMAVEKYLKSKLEKSGLHICAGTRPALGHVLETAHSLWSALQDHAVFGLFWTNLFHGDLNLATAFDLDFLNFFQSLDKIGTLENTLIVFLSDHGMRFGAFRETYIGWLEERLPMLYFWVPEQFRAKFPEKYNNLRANSGRLTSPLDLHMTLLDILGGNVEARSCPSCSSLFNLVPWNRSCSEAGITDHWCTCSEYEVAPTNTSRVEAMVDHVVFELNLLLRTKESSALNPGFTCAILTRGIIQSARLKVTSAKMDHKEFVLAFTVTPGGALFEATVQDFSGEYILMSTVSRLNLYGKSGDCIDDSELKKYCFCTEKESSQ